MIRMRSGGLDLTVMKCEGEDWMAKKKKKKKWGGDKLQI